MIIEVIKNVKEIHKNDIVLVKIGNFYHAYGRDSYIISYLFGYKIIMLKEDIATCGFSAQSLNKIIAKLEDKKINYITLDRRNNYETDMVSNNGNLNTYVKVFNKAKIYINYKRRIDNINNFLMENVERDDFKEIIKKMEEVINERRKV